MLDDDRGYVCELENMWEGDAYTKTGDRHVLVRTNFGTIHERWYWYERSALKWCESNTISPQDRKRTLEVDDTYASSSTKRLTSSASKGGSAAVKSTTEFCSTPSTSTHLNYSSNTFCNTASSCSSYSSSLASSYVSCNDMWNLRYGQRFGRGDLVEVHGELREGDEYGDAWKGPLVFNGSTYGVVNVDICYEPSAPDYKRIGIVGVHEYDKSTHRSTGTYHTYRNEAIKALRPMTLGVASSCV